MTVENVVLDPVVPTAAADQADAIAVAELKQRLADAGLVVSMHGDVSEKVAAAACRRSRGTLRNWRSVGKGPAYVKSRGRVWYPLSELARWLAEEDA